MRNQLKGHGDDCRPRLSSSDNETKSVPPWTTPRKKTMERCCRTALGSRGRRLTFIFPIVPSKIDLTSLISRLSGGGLTRTHHSAKSAKKRAAQEKSHLLVYVALSRVHREDYAVFICLPFGRAADCVARRLSGFVFCADRLQSMSWPMFSSRIGTRLVSTTKADELCISSIIQGCVDASTCLVIE